MITGLIIPAWAQEVAIVVIGIASAIYLIQQFLSSRKRDTDQADLKLVTILQGTVDALEKKVKDMEKDQGLLKRDLLKIQTENELMTKILQGRDDSSLRIHQDTTRALNENSQVLKNLCVVLEKHGALSAVA